jgi:hypothetical protein
MSHLFTHDRWSHIISSRYSNSSMRLVMAHTSVQQTTVLDLTSSSCFRKSFSWPDTAPNWSLLHCLKALCIFRRACTMPPKFSLSAMEHQTFLISSDRVSTRSHVISYLNVHDPSFPHSSLLSSTSTGQWSDLDVTRCLTLASEKISHHSGSATTLSK